MPNRIQFHRTTTQGTPPASLAPGEPAAVLDTAGAVDFYVGDQAGTPVLINPAPTPIGGVELSYAWDSNTTVGAPATGDVKINGDQDPGGASPATAMSISSTTQLGTDATAIFNGLKAGDFLGLFEAGGGGGAGGETFYWQVSAPPIDQTGWFEIAGAPVFWSGDDIDNNRPVSVFVINDPTRVPLIEDPADTDNLVVPTADHPLMRFRKRNAGDTSNMVEFQDATGAAMTQFDENGDPQEMDIDGGVYA